MKRVDRSEASSYRNYVLGFGLSLVLTLAAYILVVTDVFRGGGLVAAILALAVVQFFVQVVLFLHLGREPNPKWNLQMFLFMLLVLLILVIGTLWIMYNLNYHTMPPHEVDKQLLEDEALKPSQQGD